MCESFSIRSFTEADFSDIITISNKRFGDGYLRLHHLYEYLNNDHKIGAIALVNNKIAGFALAQIVTLDDLKKIVLSDHDWFKEQFPKEGSLGLLKMIAVSPNYSNLGIGSALTKHRIGMLKKTTNKIIAISWKQQETANTKILEKFGLKVKHKIINYWMQDSLKKGYRCSQCDVPPCKCTAIIYMME